VAAFVRREIGAPAPRPVATSSVVAARVIRPADAVAADSWQNALQSAQTWLNTYVSLRPWFDGSNLPAPLRNVLFAPAPVAKPIQVEVALGQGQISAPIAFGRTGGSLVYSVSAPGMPGGPSHGTVVVDNATGTFTYTPDETFTGTDTFSYVVRDTSVRIHGWAGLLNAAFGIFNTGFAGGNRDTATVTVFNNVAIQPDPRVAQYTDITGVFSALTYNIAGLPFVGSPFSRIADTLRISSLLNKFDLVNVQEDVAYHMALVAHAAFPDRTAPKAPTWLGPLGAAFSDGLNGLSAYRIESLSRHSWAESGSIGVSAGFTYSRIHIPGGSSIDLYNVDTNDGALAGADITQLSAFIQANSVGRAVIVMGDFGQLYSQAGQSLTQFATVNSLTDAWAELEYGGVTPFDAPTCAYSSACEQPDKIFYRNAALLDLSDPASSPVQLHAQTYTNEGLNFLGADGHDLSDHRPQSVTFTYSVDAIGPQNVGLGDWMGSLPGIDDLPLTQLPIPGSHDSGSYGIRPWSPWALTGISDFGVLVKFPPLIEQYIVRPIAAQWSRTQAKNFYGQLSDGIRYLDLRLTNEPDGNLYFEHGLRGAEVEAGLQDISQFAHEHPKEVIIVYAQQFTNFSAATHSEFVGMLNQYLGDRMAPSTMGTDSTLQDFWNIDKNVIVVYNNAPTVAGDSNLWPDNTLYRPWPNTPSTQVLLAANETNLHNRPPGSIWGMFGEPTENVTNIVLGILGLGPSSLHEFMVPVHPKDQQWIRAVFKNNVNLVTADWYNLMWPSGTFFARDVIGAGYETAGVRLSQLSGQAIVNSAKVLGAA
jgi:hypothetical protein